MKKYKILKTDGDLTDYITRVGNTKDLWVHDYLIMNNETEFTDDEINEITDNLEDLDAINHYDEWEEDENGEAIVSVKKDELMFLLIAR